MYFFSKVLIAYLFFSSSKLSHLNELVSNDDDEAFQKEISNVQKLTTKLLNGYDATVRPVTHHSNTTTVYFDLIPLYIVNLIEELSLFQIDSFAILQWQDYRLSWKSEDYDGLKHIQLGSHMVWQPDIAVYNGHSGSIDPTGNTHLLLFSDGSIYFLPPAILDTHCPVKQEGDYPGDKVTCKIIFGSWAHDGWQIDLQPSLENGEMYMSEFDNNHPRWELLTEETNMIRNVQHYNCCEEPYFTLIATFPLKRRAPQELQVVWAPCVLVMAITLTMFWIHPSSTKKILFSGFLLLALCILAIYVAIVTKSPTSVKRAVTFLESTLYALTSVIIIEILVMNVSQISGPCRPPDTLIQILSNPWAKYFLIWPTWTTKIESDKVQLKEEDTQSSHNHPTPKEEWTLVAIGLDRLFFFVYIIVFAAIHQI